MAITVNGTNVKRDGVEYPAGAVERVDTLATLKALIPSDGWLRSYDQRLWVYEVSSTVAVSNDAIAPNSGQGRWIAQQYATGPIDAYYYGVRTANSAAVNTANLNAALSLAATGSGVVEVIHQGAYSCNGTISVPIGVALVMSPNAYLEFPTGYTNVGVLIQGHGNSMTGASRHEINVRKQTYDWYSPTPTDTSSVGIKVLNSDDMHLAFRAERWFCALDVVGDGSGSAYNTFYPLYVRDSKIGIRARGENGGWANENKIFGGRISGTSSIRTNTTGFPATDWIAADGRRITKAAGIMPGTCYLDLSYYAAGVGTVNNWVVTGVSLEGDSVERFVDIGGYWNTLVGNRYESSINPKRLAVHFRSTAQYNVLIGGYNAFAPDHNTSAIFLDESPDKDNVFIGARGMRMPGTEGSFGGPSYEARVLGSSNYAGYRTYNLNGVITQEILGNGSYEYYPNGKQLSSTAPANLAAFTALTPTDLDEAHYSGYLWVYDDDATETADGTTIIEPDSGTGRWFRTAPSGTDLFPYRKFASGKLYIGQGDETPREVYQVTGTTTATYGFRWTMPQSLDADMTVRSGVKLDVLSGAELEISSGATVDMGGSFAGTAAGTFAIGGATPIVQQSAIGALTDSSGGSADGTVAAVSGSGADSDINNNFAELSAKVNALIALLGDTSGFGFTAD